MSPFTAKFFVTTSRGYPKGASTLDYYGVVAVEPRPTSAKLLNVRVFWSNMRVLKNVRVFENMSRKKLASTLAIVSPGPPPSTYGVVGTQKYGCGLPYVDRAQWPETGATPTRATIKSYHGR